MPAPANQPYKGWPISPRAAGMLVETGNQPDNG
jgi:hypothetical protein